MSLIDKKEPSAEEMKAFAAQFSKEQWARLCQNPNFVQLVSTNLVLARRMAIDILQK